MLLEIKIISSCWTWYDTDVFLRLWPHRTMTVASSSDTKKIHLLDLVCNWFSFLFCHPTIRVAMVLEFETISSCWIWYGTDVFLRFQHHRTMRVAFLSDTKTISSCWTWYGALLSETETISSCWTWYATDVSFPFISTHYQSRYVIRIWNNIKLLDLVCYWYLFSFFVTPLSESPCD